MNEDIEAVVTLLRDPANAELYRDRCRQAAALEDQLASDARELGIPIWQPPVGHLDPRTKVGVSFELGKFTTNRIEHSYRAHVGVFCLADAFEVQYSATIANRAPDEVRLHPSLQVESSTPLIASMLPIENILISK